MLRTLVSKPLLGVKLGRVGTQAAPSSLFRPVWMSGKRAFSVEGSNMKVNEKITFPEMRVIYVEDGQNKWKILDRASALQFAKSMKLDLILVNDTAQPPVCRLDSYTDVQSQMRKKEKEKKQATKVLEMKEMQFNVGIDKNDFEVKMNKVKSFLEAGHPVRTVLTFKRMKSTERMPLDELSLRVLDSLEGLVASVSQKQDEMGRRKDLVFTPKKKK